MDATALAVALLAYWRRRREESGPLLRCYHSFKLMPNWVSQEQASVPPSLPQEEVHIQNKKAYETLLNIR